MENIAIKIRNLSKSYGRNHSFDGSFRTRVTSFLNRDKATIDFLALDNISFDVEQGSVVGIIGRNGAGKSTLLKILSRITTPSSGYVEFYGRVGSLLEVGTGFHHELSGRENIYLNGALLGMKQLEIQKKFDEILDFAGVESFIDTPVKHYSSGMYVRLAFAIAAHLQPEILLVDEVLSVGDYEFQKKCLGKIESVSKEEGRTVLFVSHDLSAVKKLCSSCVLLDQGRMSIRGSVSDCLNEYLSGDVKDSKNYIGHDIVKQLRVSNDQTEIVIELDIKNYRNIDNLNLGFVVENNHGAKLFGHNQEMNRKSIVVSNDCQNKYTLIASVLTPQLIDGEYRLFVWLGDGRGDFFSDPDGLVFKVEGMRNKAVIKRTDIGNIIPTVRYDYK